jgi:hypothetical protein
MKQLCIGLVIALTFSTVASAASWHHYRHHYRYYGHSYRAAPGAGTAAAARFQRHFDNN